MCENKINGQCHCGKIKYEVGGEKKFEFFCHCLDCRVLNGGGRLAGLIFDKEKLVVSGSPKQYSYAGGSGKDIEFYFCVDCGTPLYAYPTAHDGAVVIRANSLNDCKDYTPAQSIFEGAAFSWDKSAIT